MTNDWFCGLTPAYPKTGAFGQWFNETKFFHLVHNLSKGYEGQIYSQDQYYHIHQIPTYMLCDDYNKGQINPSRCALMNCDQWGTVSRSYRSELLNTSPLKHQLKGFVKPFGFPNGVPVQPRLESLIKKCGGKIDHLKCKEKIQQKYFGFEKMDDSVKIFSFVGRITEQKGVLLILDVVEDLLNWNKKIQFLIGGPITRGDPYGEHCASKMLRLKKKYPYSFWCSPMEFFYDGPVINVGSDFCLMPSLFEPGGIVQHEYFLGSTPVIAYKTGGLKDTVFEFDWNTNQGNGCNFDVYTSAELRKAIERAFKLCNNKAKYAIARANAFESVIDVAEVSRAWNNEFYRIHNKIFIDPELLNVHKDLLINDWSK